MEKDKGKTKRNLKRNNAVKRIADALVRRNKNARKSKNDYSG